MHVSEFGGKKRAKTGFCSDESENCAAWAAAGECTKNPGYMLGTVGDGACLKSCGKCPPAAAHTEAAAL